MSKIKVLYVCHTPITKGGATFSLLNMIEAAKDFVEPVVLFPSGGQAYELFKNRGIKCIIEPFSDNIYHPLNRRLELLRRVREYYRRLKFDNNCVKNILETLKSENIDVVHSNSSVITVGPKIAKALRCKHVWHIREYQNLDFGFEPLNGWRLFINALKRSDAIIGITYAIVEHFKVAKLPQSYCIWNAVRHKDEIVYIKEKEKFLLFCATYICKGKGAELCVEAFGLSNLASKGYKLLMIGQQSDTDIINRINEISVKYDLDNSIEFLGFCDDVGSYMAKASVFIMSSDCEGMGRVTIEAMFYGCPVIGRATGGTAEIITHNETGFLFTNVNECAELMVKTCTSDNTAIIKNAHDFVKKNFTVECYGEKIVNVYKTLLQ